jgi:putative endonuclease
LGFCAWIRSSHGDGALCIGHTDRLSRRVWQHQDGDSAGVTHRHGVNPRVYYEGVETRLVAFGHGRRRTWEIERIDRSNPDGRDLSKDLPSE